MACTDINNFFETEANRISRETSEKGWITTPWDTNDIVPKTVWEDGMGETPNFIIFDRSMPLTNLVQFQTVTFNDGGGGDGGGSCSPPTATVYQSTRRLSMSLKKGAIQSQKICIEDGRMSWNIAQQAEHVLRNLQMNTRHAWQNARRDEFTTMCTNKAIADTSMTTNSASFGTGTIGKINRQMLEYWYHRLIGDGAHQNNGLARTQYNMPLLPLILSLDAQRMLVENDATRNDIRWSRSSSNLLLGPPGSFTELNGFKHMIDLQAARWNLVNGSWVRVPYYLPANSAGDAADVNPAYYTAEYEDIVIGSNQVVKFAIPGANLRAGPMTFQAQDYLGNFRWINKYDAECNVDENIGFFRGVLGYGAQPVIPEYGVVLRFKLCPNDWEVDSTCS